MGIEGRGTGKTVRFCILAVMILALLAAAFNAITGLMYTAEIEVDPLVSNIHVVIHRDPVVKNLCWLAVGIAICMLLARIRVSRTCARLTGGAVLLLIVGAGVLWVCAVRSDPYADGMHVIDFSQYMIHGSDCYIEYLRCYPHQLSYALFAEMQLRIFGVDNVVSLAVCNVAFLALAYAGLLRICELLFDDARVEFLTAALMAAFPQPVFFCNWIYGNIPGFLFAVAGTVCTVSYLKRGGGWKLAAMAALLAVGGAIKQNYYIFAIANGIILLLYAVERRRWWPALAAALTAALTFIVLLCVRVQYEARTGESFSEGTSPLFYLAMGGHDSYKGPGWYDGTSAILETNGHDLEHANEVLREDFRTQAEQWRTEPLRRVAFYVQKTISQWNEPDFQSIWSARVSTRDVALSPAAQDIVFGNWRTRLYAYFNQLVQVFYVCFALGLVMLLRRKAATLCTLLLPLAFLGAFLFHLFFEAQSHYVLMSLSTMLPYCAYGLIQGSDAIGARAGKRAVATHESNRRGEA